MLSVCQSPTQSLQQTRLSLVVQSFEKKNGRIFGIVLYFGSEKYLSIQQIETGFIANRKDRIQGLFKDLKLQF